MAAKVLGGNDFTLEDFLEQMLAVRKMGPIGNLLGMMPGMGQMKEQIAEIDDRDLDRVRRSSARMTPGERAEPKIINGSRRVRIANGSGVTVTEVNQLVDRFFETRKMMQQMAGRMGLPGMRRSATRRRTSARARRAAAVVAVAPGRARRSRCRPVLAPAVRRPQPPQVPGGLPSSFAMPKIDFSKLRKPEK